MAGQQVKHLGPTKVYTLMKAPADQLMQLLKHKQLLVPGDAQTKKLEQLAYPVRQPPRPQILKRFISR